MPWLKWAWELLQLLLRLFVNLSEQHAAVVAPWWKAPGGATEVLFADLKEATQKQYQASLLRFWGWVNYHKKDISTIDRLDRVAFEFCAAVSRHQAQTLLAALLKAYPPVRQGLPWMAARVRTMISVQPPTHHSPLPWIAAVLLAWSLVCAGLPNAALLVLVQWRFGLRPKEAVTLKGGDAVRTDPSHGLGYLRLGIQTRGTKARRQQVARARPFDPLAEWLISLVVQCVSRDQLVGNLRSYESFLAVFKRGLRILGIHTHWTPHSSRAGWASWRWAHGQSYPELKDDGRWHSDESLRRYLDVVAADAHMMSNELMAYTPLVRNLEMTIRTWLPQALGVAPF